MRIGVGVMLAILLVGGSWFARRDRSSSTSVDERAAAAMADQLDPSNGTTSRESPGERPRAGVWRYVGEGRDRFDSFGGSSHEFPDEVFTVVSLDPDRECHWHWLVPFVEEHTEQRDMCTRDGSVLNDRFVRTMTFLGRAQESRYECGDNAWRRAPDTIGRSWSWSCTEARGGRVRYSASSMGKRTITIDGEDVATHYVEIRGVQRDRTKGDELTRLWLLESGLPARFATERSAAVQTPVGVIETSEHWNYVLAKLRQ